jgi:uncharacterized membrane protein
MPRVRGQYTEDGNGFALGISTGYDVIQQIRTSIRVFWLWYAIAFAAAGLYLFWPGGFADKARLLLHGLCAQTPSHSFTFGGLMLPFDARMTGIYGGSFFTLLILFAQRRVLRSGMPPIRVMVVLALFVAIMGADGFNSLFTDLGLWHPWESRNELRLVTGYATGITLAVVLAWLLSSTVWRLSSRAPIVSSGREVALYWLPFLPFAAAVLSGWAWLYVPLSILLMMSAWMVLSLLTLSMILLALKLDDRVRRPAHLHVPGALAGVAGLAVMLLLAFGRVWLERVTGIPSTL